LALDRIERLLTALGNPEARLPPVIHVAGTNGKGSTVATLRACLEAAGYRVHVYTSPHLVRFAERIRVAGASRNASGRTPARPSRSSRSPPRRLFSRSAGAPRT
jgi:folylpolyglutamate synthase/dihydropteroate synthase